MHGSIQEPWTDLCMCVCLVCVLSLVLLISAASVYVDDDSMYMQGLSDTL